MPSKTRSGLASGVSNTDLQCTTQRAPKAGDLALDGYNFAINKMHFIMSKYPSKSEMYLLHMQVPDLQEYRAWKAASLAALLHGYTVQKTLIVHAEQLCEIREKARSSSTVSQASSDETIGVQVEPSDVDAARILTTMNFQALHSSGTLHAYDGPLPSTQNFPEQPSSPVFPRVDELPVPEGADAFLLNPILEDAQRRWVNGVHKEDQVKEETKKAPDGTRYIIRKTVYIVDGEEFHDMLPRRKRGAGAGKKRRTTSLLGNDSTFVRQIVAPLPNKKPRSKKRPRDCGLAVDEELDGPSGKRVCPDPSNDGHLSSIPMPGASLRIASTSSSITNRVSSRSTSSASQVSSHDVDNLKAILDPTAIGSIMGAFGSTGQQIIPAPASQPDIPSSKPNAEMPASSSGVSRGTQRRARPASLALAPPPRKKRAQATPSPVPMTPVATPQHATTDANTPKKNKYVPTTPNPQRWTPAELFYLNDLARKGLHPKELHPKMSEKFPDKLRSVHAIKDRRDKMARSKELQGRIPDYEARYGHV